MEKKSKKSIIIGITCLTLVTLLLLGLTYAYYRTRIVGNPNNESIHVVTKKLGISYVDNQAVITAKGIEPGYNNEANPKTFTVHNTGDEAGTFNIILDNVENEFTKGTATRGEYNDWTYELYEGTTISSDTLLKSGEITSEEKQVLINNITIETQEEITYTLIIRYAELTNVDQSDDMGSKLSIRVNIEEETISGDVTQENPLFASQPGTLLYALKTNNEITDNLANETIGFAEDDYGTSYYFRGNGENTYLNYSGMCWRIVRIDGNGNIKIVLADEKNECSEGTLNSEYSAFINGGEFKQFGEFEYAIKVWQTKNIEEEHLEMLVEAEWCQDWSIKSQNKDEYEENIGDYDGDGEDDIYSASRTYTNYGHEGNTLKCDMIGLNGSKALKVTGIFGMLTNDEIALGGNYLQENTGDISGEMIKIHFTYSPYKNYAHDSYDLSEYFTLFSIIGNLGSNGQFVIYDDSYEYTAAIRPAVVLKSTVLATIDSTSQYSPGTYQNPYKVN